MIIYQENPRVFDSKWIFTVRCKILSTVFISHLSFGETKNANAAVLFVLKSLETRNLWFTVARVVAGLLIGRKLDETNQNKFRIGKCLLIFQELNHWFPLNRGYMVSPLYQPFSFLLFTPGMQPLWFPSSMMKAWVRASFFLQW